MRDSSLVYLASKNYSTFQTNRFLTETGSVYFLKGTKELLFRISGQKFYSKVIGDIKDFELKIDLKVLEDALYFHGITDETNIGEDFYDLYSDSKRKYQTLKDVITSKLDILKIYYI